MDALLDKFCEDTEHAVRDQFRDYYVKVSQLNSLVKCRRDKILGEKRKFLFDRLKVISEEIYDKYASLSKLFEQEYFPYFKLAKSYSNYHFHFLVVKKDYAKYRK